MTHSPDQAVFAHEAFHCAPGHLDAFAVPVADSPATPRASAPMWRNGPPRRTAVRKGWPVHTAGGNTGRFGSHYRRRATDTRASVEARRCRNACGGLLLVDHAFVASDDSVFFFSEASALFFHDPLILALFSTGGHPANKEDPCERDST